MEMKPLKGTITQGIKKYKYAVIVLAAGLAFMLIPSRNGSTKVQPVQTSIQQEIPDMQTQLEQILSRIKGAGEVKVLLTQAKGERVVYQTDKNSSVSDSSTTESLDTVIVTDTNKNETGLIVQIEPPEYLGAIVVSQGADEPTVKLALVEAVCKVTGLGANEISVLKMK